MTRFGELDRFTIFLRDNTYAVIERLDKWLSLTAISRLNRTGTWDLEVPIDSNLSTRITPTTGIIIQCDGVTIFSGPGGSSYEETSKSIKLSGTDDNVLLETPARPNPNQNTGPYPDEYDVTTGIASTIMRSLVDRNIGPSAPSFWKIPQLTLAADPVLGSTITARARFDPLATLLYELGSTPLATGLTFRILQSDISSQTLVFSISQPRDLSGETIFSTELKTAEDYQYIHQIPEANWFIVAGGDDFGANRTVVEDGDAASIAEVGRRVTQFVDRRGVDDPSELEQELAELIAGTVTTRIINIIPTTVPSLPYKDAWDLGDLVTAVVRSTSYDRLITEITYEFTNDRGLIIKPSVADPFGSNDDLAARHANTLANRISNIERNFNVPNNSIIGDMLHITQRTLVGDIKHTARSSAQTGWLLCDGSAINRNVYSELFIAIGTTFGVGDGSTTFNIPDLRGKFIMGKGPSNALGTSGGSTSASFSIAHSHPHSHGMNNHTHASQSHTHPGSHSHGIGSHTHTITHTHPFAITGLETGLRNNDSVGAFGFDEPNVSSGSEDHHHNVEDYSSSTSGSSAGSSGASSGSTDSDNNAHSASYSGSPSVPSINSTEPDSASTIVADTVPVVPPYQVCNVEIYTNVP